jgi:hypothetical protein
LGNPLEVVEVACADSALSVQLQDLLGLSNGGAVCWEQLGLNGDTLLVEVVKWIKAPGWRYRTEVLGLVDVAVQSVTSGHFHTINQVRKMHLSLHFSMPVHLEAV